MPIDHTHAFSNGVMRARPTARQRLLWRALAPFSLRAQTSARIARAWAQFERSALVSDQCMLGPNAWCVNMSGERAQIRVEGKVLCRGVLRVESFGSGQILVHPDVYIGDDVLISCADRVEIGSFTLIAHGVQIFDNNTHPAPWRERQNDWQAISERRPELKPAIAAAAVRIGSHVWIGFNSIILKGVTIGDRSIVAAGSVVTQNVPMDTLVGGNPARVLRTSADLAPQD